MSEVVLGTWTISLLSPLRCEWAGGLCLILLDRDPRVRHLICGSIGLRQDGGLDLRLTEDVRVQVDAQNPLLILQEAGYAQPAPP